MPAALVRGVLAPLGVENVQLRHLPIWDIEGQCITLHSKDERAVLKATKKLERMLEEE